MALQYHTVRALNPSFNPREGAVRRCGSERKRNPERSVVVEEIAFSSGEEPDGLDDDWGADMFVRGSVRGLDAVAKLLGIQKRTVGRKLPKTRKATLIDRITGDDNAISRELLKTIRRHAVNYVNEYGMDELGRTGSVSQVEYLDSQDLSAASISKLPNGEPKIDFEIEVGVLGEWNGSRRQTRIRNLANRLARGETR